MYDKIVHPTVHGLSPTLGDFYLSELSLFN